MSEKFEIISSLPDKTSLEEVLDLYFEAFGLKAVHLDFLTPRTEIIRSTLRECIKPEYGIYALRSGRVVGFLALEDGKNGRFYDLRMQQLIRHFGLFGGLWRAVLHALMNGHEKHGPETIRIDTIAVNGDVRGLGIGSRLLEAADEKACQLGRKCIALEVIDTNPRAQLLYERHGYAVIRKKYYGRLTRRAGFDSLHLMRKALTKGSKSRGL